jgi:hypothetical protein
MGTSDRDDYRVVIGAITLEATPLLFVEPVQR